MPSLLPDATTVRSTWLRRFSAANPLGIGATQAHLLYAIGSAAARETLVTATHHMSAIWSTLFQDLLCPGPELRWLDDGPGFGRDARTAYSGLLGRYLARAYPTANEGVLVLVPLDVAKHRLRHTPYSIHKLPAGSRGLLADWIGLDVWGHLVIAEAKGSYDRGYRTWRGPSRPQLLTTAESQASRTVIRRNGRRMLPARRWAVLSRWGTAQNHREPTLIASCDDGPPLAPADYSALVRILLDSDRRAVLTGLGHLNAAAALPSDDRPRERLPGDIALRVRGIDFPSGYAALAGPFGFRPLRSPDDLASAQDLVLGPTTPRFAVASFSSRHATTFPEPASLPTDPVEVVADSAAASAAFSGLSVAWPFEMTDIQFRDL